MEVPEIQYKLFLYFQTDNVAEEYKYTEMVSKADLEVGRLYPPLKDLREISVKIATKVAEEAYKSGTASTYPEPPEKETFIREQLFDYNYEKNLPAVYQWPDE